MWHPIKNGLPEDNTVVAFCQDTTGNSSTGLFKDGVFWVGVDGQYEEFDMKIITHWHALPHLPERTDEASD